MTQPLNNSPLHDGAAGAKETERDAVMIDSRTAMKAGALALLGLSANALFRGLLSVANASEDSSAPSSSRAAGPSDARVGELAMASVAGYKGKSGTWRNGVPTSCVQCVAICTIIGYEENGKIVKIEGNPDGPNNGGCICAKAQAGVNQVYDPDRLLYPLVRTGKRGEGKWKRISMDEALDLAVNGGAIAGRQVTGLKAIYESGKPEEFMLHYGRNRIKGPLEHFCKAAFGTGTIGNHTSICEGAKFVGQEVSMGKSFDVNDVEHSKYVLILGANILEAHTSHSYFAQRLTAARAAGARVVTFDVRLSNTAAKSDEWVPVLPGTDLAVILAMTNVVLTEQPEGKPLYDEAFVNKWTNVTIDELKEHYARYTPAWAEKESSVPAGTIRRIALELASIKPSTIVTYRGYVGHYNGVQAEWAARTLDALIGNFNVKGGTNVMTSGKCKEAYADEAAKAKSAFVRKDNKLNILAGEKLHLANHDSCQWIYERIADGSAGRPKLYMTYVWNGAYTTGDCQRNREILMNEEYFPFIVAVDVAMSETTELADLVIPDATYLERWTIESTQSMAMLPFIQIRQPVIKPMGEATDMQDIFIQLAQRIGGGMAELHPYKSAQEYTEACIRLQDEDNARNGKTFYAADGKPLEGSGWEYFQTRGVLLQAAKPSYNLHEKKLSDKDLAGTVVDEKTGVVWDPEKAHVSEEDVKAKGYTGSKNAYKGYAGQMIDGVAYKGFGPDKINKSGRFEARSEFMKPAAELVMADIGPFLRDDEGWVAADLASGLPSWVPVPEHRVRTKDQLIMTSFKVNVQTQSRTQNCKWLEEIYHNNPAWINPATARRLLGPDAKEGDLVRIKSEMPELAWRKGKGVTTAREIITRLHLTEGIHPDVIAVSFHCGHWTYGRYASGQPVTDVPDDEKRWWQSGRGHEGAEPGSWSDWTGAHPNWIIPNTPSRVGGQFRSNDTIVSISRV